MKVKIGEYPQTCHFSSFNWSEVFLSHSCAGRLTFDYFPWRRYSLNVHCLNYWDYHQLQSRFYIWGEEDKASSLWSLWKCYTVIRNQSLIVQCFSPYFWNESFRYLSHFSKTREKEWREIVGMINEDDLFLTRIGVFVQSTKKINTYQKKNTIGNKEGNCSNTLSKWRRSEGEERSLIDQGKLIVLVTTNKQTNKKSVMNIRADYGTSCEKKDYEERSEMELHSRFRSSSLVGRWFSRRWRLIQVDRYSMMILSCKSFSQILTCVRSDMYWHPFYFEELQVSKKDNSSHFREEWCLCSSGQGKQINKDLLLLLV